MKAQVEQEVEAANWRLATLRALQPAALRWGGGGGGHRFSRPRKRDDSSLG